MVAALTALALALAASSAEPAESVPLTLAEALALAERAPGPQGASRALEASRAEGAHLSPLAFNPQLSLEPGVRQDPSTPPGFDLRVGLAQTFNLAGQPQARHSAVQAEQAALQAQGLALLLTRRLATAEAWLGLWLSQQLLTLTHQSHELSKSLLHALEHAAAQGTVTRLDVAQVARVEAEALLAELEAEGTLVERQVELARLLSLPQGRPPRAEGSLPEVELPPVEALAPLVERAARLPAPLARTLEARAERARAAEARADRGLQLQAGLAGVREYDRATGAVATLTLTPPLFNRGERERSGMLAQAELREGEAREASAQAAAELALTFHEVEHTRAVRHAMQSHLLPAAEQEALLSEHLQQAGEATLPEVLQARRVLLEARSRLARAQAAEALARLQARLLVDALATTGDTSSSAGPTR